MKVGDDVIIWSQRTFTGAFNGMRGYITRFTWAEGEPRYDARVGKVLLENLGPSEVHQLASETALK